LLISFILSVPFCLFICLILMTQIDSSPSFIDQFNHHHVSSSTILSYQQNHVMR
jgi:hypothetical protein